MWIFIGIVFCVGQVALGLAVGKRLRGNSSPAVERHVVASPGSSASIDLEDRQANILRSLTVAIADDVACHNDRIEHANHSLNAIFDANTPAERAALASTIAEILRANQELQDQLSTAHSRLDEQSKELDTRLTESRTDSLTGLANRRACDEELARRCSATSEQGKTCSVMMVDVDHFKKFNDAHGHDAGDYVLREVAQAIANAIGPLALVTRFGGEEFCAILPELPLEAAAITAERIRLVVAESRFAFNGTPLSVTLSLGVAMVGAGETPASVVSRADIALYSAKRDGRNCAHAHDGTECSRIGPPKPPSDGTLDHQPETASGADRRAARRHAFECEQAIARYQGSVVPSYSAFRTVRCRDLSATGCCFVTDEPLDFTNLTVALGVPPNLKYVAAKVTHVVPIQDDGALRFRVGCRFLQRVSKESTNNEMAMAVAGA